MKTLKTIIEIVFLLSTIMFFCAALWISFFMYQSHAMTGVTFGIVAGLFCVVIMSYVLKNH